MQSELDKVPSMSDPQTVFPAMIHPLVMEQIFLFSHPIGTIYYNKIDPRNPTEIFGLGCGTWVAIEGMVIVGKAPSGTFATAGATGGAETHTLTTAQMPAHAHSYKDMTLAVDSGAQANRYMNALGGGNGSGGTNTSGGGDAHTNLQPYTVAMCWERTA